MACQTTLIKVKFAAGKLTARSRRGKSLFDNPLRKVLFPRPNRRGPIEASLLLLGFLARFWFPRPNRRGPIEAMRRRRARARERRFPRPNRRGPIEAGWGESRAAARHAGFHVRIDVAPLKRGDGGRVAGESEFPRPNRRGPIEAWCC